MANRKLKPINRAKANVEAERGETVVTSMFGPNVPENYIIEGEKHKDGGTPLDLPKDSFIFSNSKELRITDNDVLSMFDMPKNKIGYTPAEIAKKYDINKYKEILLNPDSDNYQKDTATIMINNMFDKLSALALYQESMKGFPQGVPSIAIQFMEKNGISPQDLVGQQTVSQTAQQPLARGGLTITGNPMADNIYNTIQNSSQEMINKFSPQTLMQGPMMNDGKIKTDTNQTTKKTDTNNDGKIKTDTNQTTKKTDTNNDGNNIQVITAKKFDINIPMNADAALFDVISSSFRNIDTARRQSQIANMFSGEEKSIYVPANYGDYVESGTQYGTFRPNEQVIAVNPQNIVTNNGLKKFDKGGPFTDDEKKRILNNVIKSEKDKNNVEFLDEMPSDINKLDRSKIYIVKDNNGKVKIYNIKAEPTGIDLTDEQKSQLKEVNDDDKTFLENAYKLLNVYNKSIEDIDAQIQAESNKSDGDIDKTKIKDLLKLKRLQYTNKQVLMDIVENPNAYKDKKSIFNYLLSNKSDIGQDKNELLDKISQKDNVDKNLLLKKKEVKEAQKIYNDTDRLKELGYIPAPFGFDEKGMPKFYSPEDNLYGNTTAAYVLAPNSIYKNKLYEKEYSETPGLDNGKVTIKPDEKKTRTPFFTQDMVNLANAISEKANIKKYMPYQEIPEVFLPEATYVSPERALAANQETTSAIANMASTLGTPQSYAATASLLAGQQMANNANVIANTHNMNVQIANQNDAIRNQILNSASAQKAQLDTNLYDKTVIANQQFDNAKREATRNIVSAFNQAWTNRGLADTMNKTSDYFSIDPITYTTYFDKEKYKELEAKKQTTSQDELFSNIQKINDMGNISEDTKKTIIESMAKAYYEKNKGAFMPPQMPYMPSSLYNTNN